jgi:hypothetical protein
MGSIVNILTQNNKMAVARVIGIAMIWAFTLFPSESFSQVNNGKPAKLIVGTMDAAPFAMKTADGVWKGLSVDLWQKVASVLGVQYELQQFNTIGTYLDAVEKGKLDVVIALAVTEKRETFLDLSQSYYRSGLAIAVSGDSIGRSWFGFAESMDISIIFKVIGLLVVLWLMAGAAVWVFESRRNREMFGGGPIKGLCHAVWWAVVTMTTVGTQDAWRAGRRYCLDDRLGCFDLQLHGIDIFVFNRRKVGGKSSRGVRSAPCSCRIYDPVGFLKMVGRTRDCPGAFSGGAGRPSGDC